MLLSQKERSFHTCSHHSIGLILHHYDLRLHRVFIARIPVSNWTSNVISVGSFLFSFGFSCLFCLLQCRIIPAAVFESIGRAGRWSSRNDLDSMSLFLPRTNKRHKLFDCSAYFLKDTECESLALCSFGICACVHTFRI